MLICLHGAEVNPYMQAMHFFFALGAFGKVNLDIFGKAHKLQHSVTPLLTLPHRTAQSLHSLCAQSWCLLAT